jgi:hypothetical protein
MWMQIWSCAQDVTCVQYSGCKRCSWCDRESSLLWPHAHVSSMWHILASSVCWDFEDNIRKNSNMCLHFALSSSCQTCSCGSNLEALNPKPQTLATIKQFLRSFEMILGMPILLTGTKEMIFTDMRWPSLIVGALQAGPPVCAAMAGDSWETRLPIRSVGGACFPAAPTWDDQTGSVAG